MQAARSMQDFFKKCLEDGKDRGDKIKNLPNTAQDLLWRLQDLDLDTCKIGKQFLFAVHSHMQNALDSIGPF